MKESKLIEMSNRIDTIGAAMNRVVQEIGNLKDLSIGTMELIKEFPDYKESLEKLKISLKEKQKEKPKE
jgi:predicted ATP-grasp superfamily ATP-dependent carboligase|tara:strand:- start:660 stop:866 length:207 start_codon:yes stop_codon:yes gene_type:complete